MTDPFDDPARSRAGFVVTATGLRVPVATPAPHAGWPAPDAAGSASRTEARFRGVGPKGYQRSDPHVREQICERLLLDPYLDASRLSVRVSKGRVTLSGRVPTERMRSAAVAAASSVAAGAVEDALAVDAAAPARPSRIAKASGTRAKRTRKRGGSR
jgi:hypothetical protein